MLDARSDSNQSGFVWNASSNSHIPLNILLICEKTLPRPLTHYLVPQYIHRSPLPVSMYTLLQDFSFFWMHFLMSFAPKTPRDLLSGAPCLSPAEFSAFKNTLNLPGTKWDMKNQFQLQRMRWFPSNKSS